MDDPAHAGAVIAAVTAFGGRIPVLGLPGSALQDAADQAGIRYATEAFADRSYTPDGRLTPRSEAGAVLTSTADVVAQALARAGSADSLCLHSDTPGALGHARAVRAALTAAGVPIEAFAR
jgi:UPF0271 protein